MLDRAERDVDLREVEDREHGDRGAHGKCRPARNRLGHLSGRRGLVEAGS
ncbi:hypothetical protein ACFPRL_30775 [Pseudoclavibacter helvolus]